MDYLRLQAAANMDKERKLKEQQDRTMHLQQQLYNMKLHKTGPSVRDPKAAMRLPTTASLKFNGVNLDYIPWKRVWGETMGPGYKEAVQPMHLKISIPPRTANWL